MFTRRNAASIASLFVFLLLSPYFVHGALNRETIYPYNPNVDIKVWEELTPHFLPEDHPIKPQMDRIFNSGKRISLTLSTLREAGFKCRRKGKKGNTIISRHSDMPGYWIKLYTDEQLHNWDVVKLRDRVINAEIIKNAIEEYSYQSFFKVPRKWIYPLPVPSQLPEGDFSPKAFVVIAEHMEYGSFSESRSKWKSEIVTYEFVDALFKIISLLKMTDYHMGNLPFSEDGKVVFIDLELDNVPPDPMRLGKRLTHSKKTYWMSLFDENGLPKPSP